MYSNTYLLNVFVAKVIIPIQTLTVLYLVSSILYILHNVYLSS